MGCFKLPRSTFRSLTTALCSKLGTKRTASSTLINIVWNPQQNNSMEHTAKLVQLNTTHARKSHPLLCNSEAQMHKPLHAIFSRERPHISPQLPNNQTFILHSSLRYSDTAKLLECGESFQIKFSVCAFPLQKCICAEATLEKYTPCTFLKLLIITHYSRCDIS